MTTYTVRDATDHPLQRFTDLDAAVTAVDAECQAHTDSPGIQAGDRIHRIVTADLHANDIGDVLYGKTERAGDRID